MEKRCTSLLLVIAMIATLFSGLTMTASAEGVTGEMLDLAGSVKAGDSQKDIAIHNLGTDAGEDSPEDIDVYFVDWTDTETPHVFCYEDINGEGPSATAEDMAYPGDPQVEAVAKEMNGHNYYKVTLNMSSVDTAMFGDGTGEFGLTAAAGHTKPLSYAADAAEPPEALGGNKFVAYAVKLQGGVLVVAKEADVWPDVKQTVVEPSCTEEGTLAFVGLRTGAPAGEEAIPALGHDWDEGVVIQEPTQTEPGLKRFTCLRCNVTENRRIPELGHVHEYTETVVPPTCTEQGYTLHQCACGDSYKDNYTNALGHAWDEGTVVVEPKHLTPGEKTCTCTRCGIQETVEIPRLGNPFEDVHDTDFFFNPVMWALDETVTGGIDDTHFAPGKTVMRSDSMMFFWAANKRPKPTITKSPFKDVGKKHWAFKPIMWGVENGVTGGTGPKTFSPDKTCSRSEILQFLYAAMGKPEYHISNPYSDLKSDQWYYGSAIWAYENGLEKGKNGKFKAKTPCTRGYVVTYLYRFFTHNELAE